MNFKNILVSRGAKKAYLLLAFLVLLFVICNDFLLPWYVNQGSVIEVPSVIDKNFEEARTTLASIGLEARQGDVRVDKDHPAGAVIVQNPAPGSKVKKGRRIYLTISEGEQLVEVPNIKGRTLRDASFELEREGLILGAVEYQSSEEFPPNTVIEQGVPAGKKVKKDVYVSVVISQGKTDQKVQVPDLKGKALTDAGKLLANLGLKLGNITYVPSAELLPNTIVDQFPRPNDLVIFGQAVDLFVVQGGEKKKDTLEN